LKDGYQNKNYSHPCPISRHGENLDITAAHAYLDNRASKSNSTVQYAPLSANGLLFLFVVLVWVAAHHVGECHVSGG